MTLESLAGVAGQVGPANGRAAVGSQGDGSLGSALELLAPTDIAMKRKALEARLRNHGGEHDIWINPTTRGRTAIPRHTEINPFTVRSICR